MFKRTIFSYFLFILIFVFFHNPLFAYVADDLDFMSFDKSSRVKVKQGFTEVRAEGLTAGIEKRGNRYFCRKDGKEMIFIPAGAFLYGYGKKSVKTEAFFIDKYPVTNAEYALFIKAGGYTNRGYWSREGWDFILRRKIREPCCWRDEKWNKKNHPVVGVSWYEAEAYAKWANKELPAEIMWEKAARGTDGRRYPWGNKKPNITLCNFAKNEGRTTTPVDKYKAGKSPYGVYDMSGNVWEWCRDWYNQNKKGKVLRGGSWFNDNVGIFRSAYRVNDFPNSRNISTGFRCVRT